MFISVTFFLSRYFSTFFFFSFSLSLNYLRSSSTSGQCCWFLCCLSPITTSTKYIITMKLNYQASVILCIQWVLLFYNSFFRGFCNLPIARVYCEVVQEEFWKVRSGEFSRSKSRFLMIKCNITKRYTFEEMCFKLFVPISFQYVDLFERFLSTFIVYPEIGSALVVIWSYIFCFGFRYRVLRTRLFAIGNI